MKVLVIGSGGREHSIIKALKKSEKITKLFAAPGNGGISFDAECVKIKAVDILAITDFAVQKKIDYIVVAPDDPLAIGMVDALEAKGLRCFGPNKAAARIESSKVFSKNLMKKYGIPTATYESFSDSESALNYVKSNSVSFPLVIKADGLALGKGVIIAETREQAATTVTSIMVEKKFGDSGCNIVIEEFLTGPEVSVLSFSDGKTLVPMVSSMDHKRAFDGNTGPNTGGMGVIAPNPHYTKEIAAVCEKTIFAPTIRAMREEGCPFKGCLYFGLMLTKRGPMVIEYNCRFGDPEAQAVIPLLKTSLFEIMEAVTDEKLDSVKIDWLEDYSACVVLASGGYPVSYKTGFEISGLDSAGGAKNSEVVVYHAGTEFKDGKFFTAGGRVLGVTATGKTNKSALESAYKIVENIIFNGKYCRKDIGTY
jgi:phosphoribosylamine---glycine ligase